MRYAISNAEASVALPRKRRVRDWIPAFAGMTTPLPCDVVGRAMNPRTRFELRIGGSKVRLGERTLIMGVLNVTPDSFSDGGQFLEPARAIRHGFDLVRQGADWIDVGGESTRPGSRPITAGEELRRILPVVRGLRGGQGLRRGDPLRRRMAVVPISIDTTKAEVAKAALDAGATIVNDVSGLRFDPRLAEVARRYRAPLILMHLRGRPETMQRGPFVRFIWRSVIRGLQGSIRKALESGVPRARLLVDPGLGFGKTRRQNFEILAELGRLRRLRLPIVVGTSRKSFLQAIAAGKGLVPAKSRTTVLPSRVSPASDWSLLSAAMDRRSAPSPLHLADAAAVVAAIVGGAHVVRVHDVAATLPAVRIADAIWAARSM